MGWFTKTFSSSIGRKIIMALTGLFLILFLLEHLIGNALLLKKDGGAAFNEYAHFMKENIVIIIGEVVLFAGFLFHIVDGILLMAKNRSARPVKYAVSNKSEVTSWTSKLMGPFGIVILLFLALHLYNFFRYKYFAEPPMVTLGGVEMADMSTIVYDTFKNPLEVGIYLFAMLIVSFHLYHGFQSAFQTMGLNHVKYNRTIKATGVTFSILVPLGLALIPLIIFLGDY